MDHLSISAHALDWTRQGRARVHGVRADDLLTWMQLRSRGYWTYYILEIFFWFFGADSELLGEVTRLRIIPEHLETRCDFWALRLGVDVAHSESSQVLGPKVIPSTWSPSEPQVIGLGMFPSSVSLSRVLHNYCFDPIKANLKTYWVIAN